MVRRILLPALLVWCAGTGWALDSSRRLTQYVHRIWTTQQGLPPGTIYDIWQTRDGFLWLGTQTGLVRFDGVRFTAAETLYPGPSGESVGPLGIRGRRRDALGGHQ